MTSSQRQRVWPILALVWAALVLALTWQQVTFWRAPALDTDVMALLPGEAQDSLLATASEQIAASATRQVVVLVGGAEWAQVGAAAQAFDQTVAAEPGALSPQALEPKALNEALDYYRPQQIALLTPQQRQQLPDSDVAELTQSSLARLYAPGPSGGLVSWRDDPLNLWSAWWQERAGAIGLRDGLVALQADDKHWAVLRYESLQSAFRFDGSEHIADLLARAGAAATVASQGSIEIVHGGVPLHAEAAAARANWEVNTIGLGSLAAVVLLVWCAFRRLRPLLLVALSLGIGMAAGVAVTALLYGQVHLLTLIFGASLVGVAEDYGIHYYASRQRSPEQPPRSMMRHLLPGLALALVTSVLAYLALGLAPFPGLRQMAVFSAAGLTAAFLTVVLWFPWLDRAAPRRSGFAEAIAGSLQRWPRIRGRRGLVVMLGLLLIIGGGLAQLRVDDSLRSLRSSPPDLLASEQAIASVLGLPSPAQFYLIQATDEQELLQREEALTDVLQSLVDEGELAGFEAVSQWLPSIARQRADAALRLPIENEVRAQAGALLGEHLSVPVSDQAEPLQPADWLQLQIAEPLRALWLGVIDGQQGSVVMLSGLSRDSDLDALASIATELEGVRWVNRSAEIGGLLGHYREMMTGLALLGYLAVAMALQWRFGRRAWRALLPTALAALLSVALLGWIGEPFQLFSVLAQLLLLGIGVDYGIFLFEHREDPASWLAINVGAASTLLAFGLLSLSTTPALRSFGLSLLFGIALVWMLSPCFRPQSTE